jgi:type IV secretion system protein TrbJ
MNTCCKAALALAGAAFLTLAAPRPGRAQGAVYCVNCSEQITQWLNYLKTAEQLIKQTEMLKLSIQNTRPLAGFPAGTGATGLRELNAILAQAKSLTYAAGAIDPQFAQKFKDYNGYASAPRIDDQFMAGKRQQWSADANDATRTTLNATAKQNAQIEGPEEQNLENLKTKAETAEGNLAAQQAVAALSVETIRQLQKLRQLVMIEIQQSTNRNQNDADRDATAQAQWTQMTTPSNRPVTGGKTFKGGE